MPDDHSEVVPLLPIPNRTVKRFSADDSADSRVKVGHCQAFIAVKSPSQKDGLFLCLNQTNLEILLGNCSKFLDAKKNHLIKLF